MKKKDEKTTEIASGIINRLFEAFAERKVNALALSKKIGISNNYLSILKKNKGNVSAYVLAMISLEYPDIDMNWVLTARQAPEVVDDKKEFFKLIEQLAQVNVQVAELMTKF